MVKGNGKLFKVSLNIKKCTNVSGRALHQCKKSPLWKVGIRHTKKLTVKVRLHVTCMREKHSYEIGMCDQECALHACALNKSDVRV